MNKTCGKTEASILLKQDIDVGVYSCNYVIKGSLFNYNLFKNVNQTLLDYTYLLFIVEDEYLMHGNGD